MKERPILFSAPMVRAILDGRKTQTRRICKGQRELSCAQDFRVDQCPYGQPGDRLWVREGFKPIASGEVKDGYGEVRYGHAYRADAATIWAARPTIIHDLTGQPATGPMQFQERPWKSPIHMPRSASRITLEVTGVRVERLQQISQEDAIAEGVRPDPGMVGDDDIMVHEVMLALSPGLIEMNAPRARYVLLWDSINNKFPNNWNANPWVWVVEFRRVS